ncbi:sh3 domain containing protein [Ophiostoma piceae UAMH 11346]|uniref:Sh3 domain containing protein n=1 Tax=Ophiostoma piceae (strain UAMH 11346) TaxID=1262450 RepID=S3CDV8_OPHP1|nr:sh3 domain containing protein [Ophiostoma piceae UAMH 11346]
MAPYVVCNSAQSGLPGHAGNITGARTPSSSLASGGGGSASVSASDNRRSDGWRIRANVLLVILAVFLLDILHRQPKTAYLQTLASFPTHFYSFLVTIALLQHFAMSASGDARQKAMDVNRSLRTIKTELEKLLELGAMTDDEFNGIHDQLPQEWSLRSGPPAAAKKTVPAAPEASTTQAAQHPPLPVRNNSSQSTAYRAPPAAPTPTPPEPEVSSGGETAVGYASAKYKYDAPNDGDLAFERGDAIAVYNVINDDWWRGRNVRSGSVGIFPRQYIKPDEALAELERNNQLDAPPAGPPPTRSADHADVDRHANNGSAPPAYNDQYGSQQHQYGGDAKFDQPYYASQQQHQQQHQPYGQQAYAQPTYAQQPPYAQQQPYYGGGPSHEQQQQQQYAQPPQQQQQQPQGDDKLKSSGKKIGGKLGNAFVTGVGFAAGAELVGAIL